MTVLGEQYRPPKIESPLPGTAAQVRGGNLKEVDGLGAPSPGTFSVIEISNRVGPHYCRAVEVRLVVFSVGLGSWLCVPRHPSRPTSSPAHVVNDWRLSQPVLSFIQRPLRPESGRDCAAHTK